MELITVGGVLNSVCETEYEDFHRRYIHDFIRLSHRANHKNKEHEKQENEVILLLGFGRNLLLTHMHAVHVHSCPIALTFFVLSATSGLD